MKYVKSCFRATLSDGLKWQESQTVNLSWT